MEEDQSSNNSSTLNQQQQDLDEIDSVGEQLVSNLAASFQDSNGNLSLQSVYNLFSQISLVSDVELRIFICLIRCYPDGRIEQRGFSIEQIIQFYRLLRKVRQSEIQSQHKTYGIPDYDEFALYLIQKMFQSFPSKDHNYISSINIRVALQNSFGSSKKWSSQELDTILFSFTKDHAINVSIQNFLLGN